jgi:hypothetical protein
MKKTISHGARAISVTRGRDARPICRRIDSDADQLALQQSCGEDAERGGRDCYREFLATEAPDATRA